MILPSAWDASTIEAHEPIRETIHGHNDRAQHPSQAHEDGRQEEEHAHGGRNRDVLWHHLPEDHVAEENDDEGDREADDVTGCFGGTQAPQRGLHEVGDRRLGDDAQGRGCDGDAQLAYRQHEGHVAQRVQGVPRAALPRIGQRLDLGASRGGDGELAGHEEGVDGQQHDGDGQAPSGAHWGSSSPPGAGVIATWATLLPCI